MKGGIASDHGGFALKEEFLAKLQSAGHEIIDFGAHTLNPDDDYPDFVVLLAEAVVTGDVERGVAICGSGVGASVCANKMIGIRAALIHDHFSAHRGVEDDHMHSLHGRKDCWTRGGLGPRPGVLKGRVQPGRKTPASTGESCEIGKQVRASL